MKRHNHEVRSVLVAVSSAENRRSLMRILGDSKWDLRVADSFRESKVALATSSFGVAISSARLPDGYSWKDLLNVVQSMDRPPQLIVADRLADERLWAEVLNLGGYDLLATPFEPQEVLRVLPMAWNFRKREVERAVSGSGLDL